MDPKNYNNTRRILFCTANNPKKGFTIAYKWLEQTYKKQLGSTGYTGLLAELKFYENHKREYKLTVAGDMGEHADFSGSLGNDTCRFDVTTNLSYKTFSDYEPFLNDGPKYKIVLMDKINYEIIDIVSLAFEQCNCGGYKIPFILLMGENYNSHGESLWNNDQLLLKICNNCSEFEEKSRYTHSFLFSPEEYAKNLPEDLNPVKKQRELDQYCLDSYKYFRKDFHDEIMGVANHSYVITGHDGDGFWTFDFLFKNNVTSEHLHDGIDCGLL